LPVLDRKWDRVDQNFESRYKTAIKNKNICRKMLNDGFTLKEISTKMRLSFVTVYNYSTRILNEEKDI
jgi:DNA-binding NarL/FixJ family response regulator